MNIRKTALRKIAALNKKYSKLEAEYDRIRYSTAEGAERQKGLIEAKCYKLTAHKTALENAMYSYKLGKRYSTPCGRV